MSEKKNLENKDKIDILKSGQESLKALKVDNRFKSSHII